jgi:Tol biopolymer transport system component
MPSTHLSGQVPAGPNPDGNGGKEFMRKLAFGTLALALGLLVGAGTASAQTFGQNKVQYRAYDWRSITSDHFEIYFYSGLDSLAMRVLDLAEKTHADLAVRMGHSVQRRIPIILFGSHNDFAQTNVTPELIDGSTGGFTEALRNRVVLPFTGSYEDLRHVVVHELVHAVMFDLLYQGNAASLIARQSFFSPPLWFAEGMAEYYSLGVESNAEMVVRDATIEGYAPPLQMSSGYFVYKQGQLAIHYLIERYGEDRMRDLLQRIRSMGNFDRAFQRSLGISVENFDKQWREWLKKRYWPTVTDKQDPDKFARRLTDHRHDTSNLNTAPAISPQGDRVAFFSDRRQYTDVFVMSALDGKVLKRLVRGERSVAFEAIPSFRSALTWSPDGGSIALTAKSAGKDVLYIVRSTDGKLERKIELPCQSLSYPAWSPSSDSIVVTGVKDGRSDLWLVHAKGGDPVRLTDDAYDEKEPSWGPDGRTLVYASDRLAPVVLHPRRQEKGFGAYGVFELELASGKVSPLIDTFGDDHCPVWSADGSKLLFISDRNGTPNAYVYDRRDSTITQLTDVVGGLLSLAWSRENDRVVFSAFNSGGYDVFTVREPLAVSGVLARLQRQHPDAVIPVSKALQSAAPEITTPVERGALAAAWPDSVAGHDSLAVKAPVGAPGPMVPPPMPGLSRTGEPPPWVGGDRRPELPARTDSVPPQLTPLVERGGPFALPDSVLGQRSTPYKVRLAADYAGGGLYAASGYGFVGATQFLFSDFLGNHELVLSTDVFVSSLEDLNAFAIYNYLPLRWDFGGGVFHFTNYFSSQVSTLGEDFRGVRNFAERSLGFFGSASYPFDRFRRVEFNFTQTFLDRTFYEEDPYGDFFEVASEHRSVTSPSVSLIGDNTLFGYFGPVNGTRYNLTFSPSFAAFDKGLAYRTYTLDARRYWDFTHGYTFAGRVLTGFSEGRNPQTFRVGGFSTIRGFPDFDLLGSRVAIVNAELRFPFIQQLGLVGPVPIGIFHLRGAVFGDLGMVWDEGEPLRGTERDGGKIQLASPKFGFGTGIRTAVYFFLLKLDVAWRTDLQDTSKPRWHFSIGPEF